MTAAFLTVWESGVLAANVFLRILAFKTSHGSNFSRLYAMQMIVFRWYVRWKKFPA